MIEKTRGKKIKCMPLGIWLRHTLSKLRWENRSWKESSKCKHFTQINLVFFRLSLPIWSREDNWLQLPRQTPCDYPVHVFITTDLFLFVENDKTFLSLLFPTKCTQNSFSFHFFTILYWSSHFSTLSIIPLILSVVQASKTTLMNLIYTIYYLQR